MHVTKTAKRKTLFKSLICMLPPDLGNQVRELFELHTVLPLKLDSTELTMVEPHRTRSLVERCERKIKDRETLSPAYKHKPNVLLDKKKQTPRQGEEKKKNKKFLNILFIS